jgi:hypothetical protein
VTFRELRKWLNDVQSNSANDSASGSNNNKESAELILKRKQFDVFLNKPFWISNIAEHKRADIASNGACCFNHIIGLPRKDNKQLPIFDYEQSLVSALDNNKNIFIKKARGLGITEILLRYMAYLAVRNDDYKNCRFHIITGPRINLAEELIDRLHGLFTDKLGIDCKQVGPIIYVKDTIIQAFPSHTVSTMRGYTDVKFILLDEAGFFPVGQQTEVEAVTEGYRIKTNPTICIVSTPNKPGDFYESIDRDPNSIYKKLQLHYSVGLDKIYNPEQIEQEKARSYFKREYELHYSVGVGNCFLESSIEQAERLGLQYNDKPVSDYTVKILGIDPGFGSSKTAFTICEIVDGILHVIYTKQFANESTDQMVGHTLRLLQDYKIANNNWNNSNNKVLIDGSASGFIRSIKLHVGDNPQYDIIIDNARKRFAGTGMNYEDKIHLYMSVCPVNFSTKGRFMLENLKKYLDMGKIAISAEEHSNRELLTELRIATADEDMKLQKEGNATMDLTDSLRLCMAYIR